MARYLQTAAEANVTARELLALVPDEHKGTVAEKIARLVNFGIRCAPRAVQSTVRINAVKRAVVGLPVRCRLEERSKPNPRGGPDYTYKALVTEIVSS